MTRVWHISGANTGLGLELALKALAEGDRVVAAVRTPANVPDSLKHERMKVLKFTLDWNQSEMNKYAEQAVAAFGTIDVLVNMAGFAYMGAIEESEDEAVKAQFDTNVFSMLRIIRAMLPQLRAQKSGLIMNLSSIVGIVSIPTNGIYSATKFAVEALTQALAAEVAPFGIHAVVVEPGYFRTNFLASHASGSNLAPEMAVYDGTPAHEARAALSRYNGRQLGNPKLGADRMWEYAAGKGMFEGKKQLLRLPLGTDTGNAMRSVSKDLAETADHYEDVWSSTDYKE